jgi:hypothetical protein
MDEVTRNKLMDVLFDDMYGCFELKDYILYGGNFPGLRNMTDQELLEEYESYASDDDELLAEVRAAMAINKMLEE